MTGAAFLATTPAAGTYPGLRATVEVAWGADLTDLTGASWTWSDITSDVILTGGQQITSVVGRPDESQQTQTATLTLTLDNRSGNYSAGGMSPNWPYVRRGTPVRVRVSTNGGTSWNVRFQGKAVGFTPAWDAESGRWATVRLEASGPLRQINQGTIQPVSVFRRYMDANWQAENVVAYWPMEEQQGSPALPQALGGTSLGSIRFANPTVAGSTYTVVMDEASLWPVGSNTTAASSAPLTGFYATSQPTCLGYLDVPFPSSSVKQISGIYCPPQSDAQSISYIFMLSVPSTTAFPHCLVSIINDPTYYENGAFYAAYDPALNGGEFWVKWVDGFSGSYIDAATRTHVSLIATNLSAIPFRWRVSWNGTTFTLGILRQDATTETVYTQSYSGNPTSAFSLATASFVYLTQDGLQPNAGGALGHLAYHSAPTSLNASAPYLPGKAGETPTQRITRLANQYGVNVAVLDDASTPEHASVTDAVGPQRWDTITNLLREAEATGQGLIYDGLGPGLTWVTKKYREDQANGPAALTIDASAGQLMEPFAPVADDQAIVNDATVTLSSGGTASSTYRDLIGPSGVNVVGDFSSSVAVNPNDTTALQRYAQWMVALGTRQGYRYPTVSFALETNPALIPGWLACTPQSRIDVVNIASVRSQHAPDPIRLLLEGWTETIDAFTWRIVANTSPSGPWNVVTLAAATGSTGDGVCHLDTDSSQLNTNASAGATSISVKTNSGPLWVTSSADADSFPFDISIGGVRATVTAITGATSPQTFTLSTGLPRAFTAGAGCPISVWNPPVLGL